MLTFLATCTDRNGHDVVERIEAEDIKHARELLEARGYAEIVFEGDPELYGQGGDFSDQSPEMERAIRRSGRVPASVWLSTWASNLAPFLAWNAWSCWQGPPFGTWDHVGFVLSGSLVAAALLLGLPLHLYHCLLAASAWHRWDRVLVRAPILRGVARLLRVRSLEVDARFRLAEALIGKGRHAEAFAWVRELRDPASELGRLGQLCWAAGARQDALELKRQVTEALPEKADGWIDYAEILIRARDFDGARAAIERARGCELHALARAFVHFVDGVLALEAGGAERAVPELRAAVEAIGTHASNPVADAGRRYWTAHLALALAAAGERAEARAHMKDVRLFLRATDQRELLERCERAVA